MASVWPIMGNRVECTLLDVSLLEGEATTVHVTSLIVASHLRCGLIQFLGIGLYWLSLASTKQFTYTCKPMRRYTFVTSVTITKCDWYLMCPVLRLSLIIDIKGRTSVAEKANICLVSLKLI